MHRYFSSLLVVVFLFSFLAFSCLPVWTQSARLVDYSVTINALDVLGWISLPITMDGVDTGFSSPHTFTGLSGTHNFTVPSIDLFGNVFVNWTTGTEETTLIVSSGGNYTAQYYQPYDVSIWAWDSANIWISEPITMDGVGTGFSTPHKFASLVGIHNFSVPDTDLFGSAFVNWTSLPPFFPQVFGAEQFSTLTVGGSGTYTAQYYPPYNVTIRAWDSVSSWISLPITMDGVDTGFSTPHEFIELNGTHTFLLPNREDNDFFINWTTGELTANLAVSTNGTYTAQYYPAYNVTIRAWDSVNGLTNVTVYMDDAETGFSTPHDFTGLIGTHIFWVSYVDAWNNYFVNWTTGQPPNTSTEPIPALLDFYTTFSTDSGGTYTALYFYGAVPEFNSQIVLAVIFVAASALTIILSNKREGKRER
jgi:hypothetical protein